jgi:RNA polymerase sigma-70 factor (ECF subfamily)
MGIALVSAVSETELLARARQGDHRAFADLLRRHDAGLRALAFRIVRDATLMDDALQEAYVKAYRALPGFRGDAGFGTWLYRIVHNSCIDLMRRTRDHMPLNPELAVAGPPLEPGVIAGVDVANALDALSVEHRSVLVLVDALGFDYGDAAEVLDVPIGTVRSRLARARRAMRRRLETEPES